MCFRPPRLNALEPYTPPAVLLPTHPDYTVQQDGIFTVVKRVKPRKLNDAAYAYIGRWCLAYKAWLPLLLRFYSMAATDQARRLTVFVVGRLSLSLLNVVAMWSETRIDSLASSTFGTCSPTNAERLSSSSSEQTPFPSI